jgi:hypothetical protein
LDRLLAPGASLESAQEIVDRARADGACLIYHLDDNLLDLDDNTPFRKPIDTGQKMMIRYLARRADGVIVSTENLKQRMARFNASIAVVATAIDERLFVSETVAPPPSGDNRGGKTIGYMGTFTHEADIMMVAQALRGVLRSHAGDVALEFVGGFVDPSILDFFQGLPVRVLDAGPHSEYPAFVRWMVDNIKWDIAIAPLTQTRFTRCKSDIKLLDYGALGISGIYSKVEPYEGVVEHLGTGYLATNSVEAWSEAFELLIRDDQLRGQIANKARDYVLSRRCLSRCATLWRDAIENFMGHRGRAVPGG